MKLKRTDTFKKDVKKLDPQSKRSLKKIINKILKNPIRFKPLKHQSNIFRMRFTKLRLVYKVETDTITFMFVKKRSKSYKNV